jgi:hypothetical protein
MNPNTSKATSRPLGVAQKLVKHAVNEADVYSKVVVLTGEPEAISTQNGRWCFLDALALLSRVVGNLVVVLPECTFQFEKEVRDYCSQAWCQGSLKVAQGDVQQFSATANAVLCIGTKAGMTPSWTVINSNGWIARVSSGASSLPNDLDQPNALGALMAASLGVTEVFKRIYCVPHDVAPLLDKTEFSLFDLTTSPSWIGPPIPNEICLPDTLLVGAGAIGNGIALLMSQMPFRGRVHVIDKQDFADENLGTCILLSLSNWLKQPKATKLASWLRENSQLNVTGEKALIESAKSGETISKLTIDLVLNGLDDSGARREAQKMWPAILIDGGINEIGAAVVQHRLNAEDLACMLCWFEPPKVDEKVQQSSLTGLDMASLSNLDRPLTEDDIEMAAEDKRDWLRKNAREGKTVCSIITEAALSAKLGVDVDEGFRPSVPFVATAASALVVSEAVKALLFPEEPVVSKFQIDSLFLGPKESSMKLRMSPLSHCQCVVHRELINQIRTKRRKPSKLLGATPA